MMTIGDKDALLKSAAIKYFNGTATREEEELLREFLDRGADAEALFRRWEKDWSRSAEISGETEREWVKFYGRISDDFRKRRRSSVNRRIMKRIASAAAAVIAGFFGICGIAGVGFLLKPAEEYIVEIPMGQRSSVLLPDGSKVWLNAGTTLKYDERFNMFNRHVSIDGEGYFEVAKDRGRRFVVSTEAYDIRVTGTRFNVSSYRDDPYSAVTLTEGSVELKRDRQILPMRAGEMIVFDKQKRHFVRNDNGTEDAHSWIEDRMEYRGITLEATIPKLARQYDVHIVLDADNLAGRRIHISLRNNETIKDVLAGLKEIVPIEYTVDGNDIYIWENKS